MVNDCYCHSIQNSSYQYKIGELHKPINNLDKNISNGCSDGIHFFLDKEKAKKYDFK